MNAAFWSAKREGNKLRDHKNEAALIALGWPMGESDGGFGRYECIENRKQGEDRVYAAASEMRADAVALAY